MRFPNPRRAAALLLLAVAIVVLPGCGGGGGTAVAPGAAIPARIPTATAAPVAAASTAADGRVVGLAEEQDEAARNLD
ncbi:hypothetical protein DFR52_1011144 [Hoeflea marina]|uniref:Uncharacterized protein n=1 Tax=Hoeflea marina TaxID=274592 RepID=A0A317PVY2_9HYPH|nr:hypothetical protein [Hoeflea marina]PWW04446.1 hypothetical protein DFR52_1011144 [Hoeflea marina]